MIIDGLQINDWSRPVIERIRQGGVDIVHATCGVWEDLAGAMGRIADMIEDKRRRAYAEGDALTAKGLQGA